MRVSYSSGYVCALSASVALALLVGCTGVGLQSVAAPLPGFGYADAGRKHAGHVFVSDATGNVVDIFTGTEQTGQITGFDEPQGITTDRFGTLYVANTDANDVEEFAPPYGNTPTAIISDDGFPVGVAVSSGGIVAVLNICTGPSCSLSGNVEFYAKGNITLPCAVLRAGVAATPLGAAFDAKGTLYLGALNSGRVAQISEIRGGCSAKRITALATSNAITYPSAVQVDRSGNVAVLDVSAIASAQIDIYAPPAKHSDVLSLLSIAALSDAASPISFALTASGTDLFTADAGAHQVMEYAYPGGNSILQLNPRPDGLFEGIAITPAESP